MLRFATKQGLSVLRRPVLCSVAQTPTLAVDCEKNFCTEVATNNIATSESLESPLNVLDLGTLLESAEKKNLQATKACEIVIAIANLKKESKVSEPDYLQDERFLKIMKLLESSYTSKVEPMALISSLKALGELGINNESFSVKNLESTLTWSTRSCPIKEVVMLLSFTLNRRNTESQNILYNEVVKSLERRWVELKGASPLIVQAPSDNFWVLMNKSHFNALVESGKNTPRPLLLKELKDGKLFVSLLHYVELFSPQFVAKLEDRIADLMEEISPGDLALILAELGRKKRRNVPLLKSLTFYLTKHRNMLDIKQISDSLFALNQLSYKDHDTLERLCSQLENHIQDTESSPVLRSILTSLGQLKYLHTPVVDRIMAWYQARLDNNIPMTMKDMTTLLITCATLNHNPVQHSSLLEHISQHLTQDLAQPDQVWLDTVWSLTLLGRVTPLHLESVLSPAFHTSLLYNTSNKTVGSTLKLLNINAAAKLLYPAYQGPTIKVAEDALLKDIKVSPSLAKVQLTQSVMEAFSTLFPPPRLLRTNVNTLLGCVAEGEFVCDTSGKPLLVQDLSDNFGSAEPVKPLPPNAHRMALVTASFQDCLIGGGLTGLTALNIRLMEAAGYRVFLVRWSDWQPASKLVARVKMLDGKLKQVLGVEAER
eukprot:GFUD01004831.1.p1 GENE.GFUD01004831.1~~GFUD01004831.1.p1  ORF type:complete len:656 (+),score=214.52 GFUD01004831.1:71-2038(+)